MNVINPRFENSIKPVSLAESEYRRAIEVLTGMGFPPHWISEEERVQTLGLMSDMPEMRVARVRVRPALVVAEFETEEHVRFSYAEPVMPLNHRFRENAQAFADAVIVQSQRLARYAVERRMWELNEMYTMNKENVHHEQAGYARARGGSLVRQGTGSE